ncbi:transcription factor Pcc1, partial [Oesophagostomum dentatum]
LRKFSVSFPFRPNIRSIRTIFPIDSSCFSSLDLDFDTEQNAQTICRVVSVDKEPSRSNAIRSFRVQGSHLLIEIKSEDRKSLQKSIANLLDMCELAKSTIDLTANKKWLDLRGPVQKKLKLNSTNST